MSTPQQTASSRRLVIAVDGPAASGKGTLAARLAAHYNLPHLDTGLLYRAVAKKTLDAKKEQMRSDAPLTSFSPNDPFHPDTLLAVQAAQYLDIKELSVPGLSEESIGQAASIVSAIPGVRKLLLAYQHNFAAQPHGAVLDGRDIGTVICPDAPFKFFITASAEVRAQRRFKQQQIIDPAASYECTLADIRTRDARDTERTTAPLKPADDAITLDSSDMTADEVLSQALAHIQAKANA